LIFGVGQHFFPHSRHSVGMKFCDSIAEKYNLKWQHDDDIACSLAEGPNFLLVKPRTTSIGNNYKALSAVLRLHHEILPGTDLVVAHHNPTSVIGTMRVTTKYWGDDNGVGRKRWVYESLRGIEERTKLNDFQRVIIGVSPTPENRLEATIANLYNGITDDSISRRLGYGRFTPKQEETLKNESFNKTDEVFKRLWALKREDGYYESDADKLLSQISEAQFIRVVKSDGTYMPMGESSSSKRILEKRKRKS